MKKKFVLQVKNDGEGRQIVSARDLHEYLEVGRDFTTWIKERIEKYQFEENADFTIISSFHQNGGKGGRPKTDYVLRLNMAKELSMIENNDRGREARKYFIECENKLFDATNFIKETHTKLKEIKIDKKFDWSTKRSRDRLDRTEYIENMIAYLFEILDKEYSKMLDETKFKADFVTKHFWDFKTPEKYDASKESLPVLVEVEEALTEKIKKSEETRKPLKQKKLTNKD